MKKILVIFVSVLSLQSCATMLGGSVTDCQRTKPAEGEPGRKVRTVALIADILIFPPLVIVDFATHSIYKPCRK
jgi:hypothetical protein